MDSLIECQEDVQTELMLSVNLVFKGFLHHLQVLLGGEGFLNLWISCLKVSEKLLTPNEERPGEDLYLTSPREFCLEQVKNAALVIRTLGKDGTKELLDICDTTLKGLGADEEEEVEVGEGSGEN